MGCGASRTAQTEKSTLTNALPTAHVQENRTIEQPQQPQQSTPPPQPAQPQPQQPVQPIQQPEQPVQQPQPAQPQPLVKGTKILNENADIYRLLLCGTGESGKTTYIRQLKILYSDGISEADRKTFVQTIKGNMVEAIKELLVWCERNNVKIADELSEDAEYISTLDAFTCDYDQELEEKLKQFWEDPGIQEAYRHKDETVVTDHIDYFFDKIDDLYCDDYVPSDDDILRARIRSIGIDTVDLTIDSVYIRFYDVGGQRNERSKWNQIGKSQTDAIVFCLSLGEFDKPCFEEETMLRSQDSLNLFGSLTHNQDYEDKPFFFICNKYDMFEKKVRETDAFIKVFPDYTGDPHDPVQCKDYFIEKFREVSNPPRDDRPISFYTQSTLDSQQVVETTNAICDYINKNVYE